MRSLSAQVVVDGSLGPAGSLAGPNYNITADLGATRGDNLFHSFSQFDLRARDVATFSGPANIQNILSRVTGDQASSINGTIRSDIVGANFFLINPNGIVFGPSAAVDVSGAFAAGSADYLKLVDGARFVAALYADDSALSTAPVEAFGFLNAPKGDVAARGIMEVANGTSLSLVGGAVSIGEGTYLEALGGSIHLTGVDKAGEIAIPPASPDFDSGTVHAAAKSGSDIVIRGGRLVLENATISARANSGEIDIQMSDSLAVLKGAQITSANSVKIAAGNILLTAPTVVLDGQNSEKPTRVAAETSSSDVLASGGDIVVNADSVDIRHGAEISVSTFGAADAGRLEINAHSLRLEGSQTQRTPTQISANASPSFGTSAGAGGEIVIRAKLVEISEFASIFAAAFGATDAGSVSVTAESFSIIDGGVTTLTTGRGQGGEIQIDSGQVVLDGPNSLISAYTTGKDLPSSPAGNGGVINITADSIQLLNDALISTSTYGDGEGGNVTIRAGNVMLERGGSIESASSAAGSAGTISLLVEGNVLLTDASTVSTSAPQSSGGNIEVTAGDTIQLFSGSKITAQAGPGGGGSITVNAPNLIYLLDSAFDAQAEGDGGNLTIDPVFFILNRSDLISKSETANGGNITILSDYFFQSASIIDASAPFGLPGEVIVTAPEVNLSGVLVGLPGSLLDVDTLLRPDCAVRLTGDFSSFVVLGRGGLPLTPGGFVPSWMIFSPDDEH